MAAESLHTLPLRELAARIRGGDVTPTALLEWLLERIGATDGEVQAYATVCADEARREAEVAEQELAAGHDRGVLHGIPISVKDLIDTANVRTTYGSRIFADHVPAADATVVSRLRDAGAVVIGKTHTHEFALGGVTPPTRNPFDLDRIPGGSSGGSAAAVAAGSAIAALGSDTGGSIRIPASYCGVVGHKPTYGLVSRVGVFPESWSLDHVGPITRSVEDAAILLAAIAGEDPDDHTTTGVEPADYVAALTADAPPPRVGVPRNHFFDSLDPEVRAAVGDAIALLGDQGLVVDAVDFPAVDELLGAHTAIDLAEGAANHRRLYADHAHEYQPDTKQVVELGFFVRATTYIDAMRSRPRLLQTVLEAMRGVDVLVVPTQPIVAPRRGEDVVVVDGREEDTLSAMVRFLTPFNLTGMPALTMCCGYDRSGLPIGLQIVGKPFADATVLRAAHIYESCTGWAERLPA